MIRTITNITDISVVDISLTNNLYSISTLNFRSEILGEGGFGKVHIIESIDGVSTDKFLLKLISEENNKLHAFDTILLLHEKIKREQIKSQIPVFYQFPELYGVPFMAFKGYDRIEQKEVVAFLMFNLNNLGFEHYVSDNPNNASTSLNLVAKLNLSYKLSKVISFLNAIEFLHSDIDETSIFINYQSNQLALIDFDSGFHFDKQKKPSTLGKINHWISGRFMGLFTSQNRSNELSTSERISEENWVLANAIFQLIFGVMPFFFLKDASPEVKVQYYKKYRWPEGTADSVIFNPSNLKFHEKMLADIKSLSGSQLSTLIDGFVAVFNEGYEKDSKRLSAVEWKKILFKIIKNDESSLPSIESYESDILEVWKKGQAVSFLWSVTNCNAVYLDGQLQDIGNNESAIEIDDQRDVVLIAVNDFGKVEKKIAIAAKKVQPEIISFNCSQRIRNSIDPIILSWETKNSDGITLTGIEERLPSSGSIEVFPEAKTDYELVALGFFDQRITKTLEVDIIYPKIISFSYKINPAISIDNVDITWEVENAVSVSISPIVGTVNHKDSAHISIDGRTTFKILANGLFTSTERELIAHPFPVPIIESLLIPTPDIKYNYTIKTVDLHVNRLVSLAPFPDITIVAYNLNNSQQSLSNLNLKSPNFVIEKHIIPKISAKSSLTVTFNSLIQKIRRLINVRKNENK